MSTKLVIVAGDCGVYVGIAPGVAAVTSDGRMALTRSRHLRRYYVAGRTGDGSVSDLAVRGIDMDGSSVSDVVPGEVLLLGVRRVLPVSADVAASFGIGDGND